MDKISFDQLPEEAKQTLYVLHRNGMFPFNEKTEKKGRSVSDPIVIDLEQDCVRLEYLIADVLLHGKRRGMIRQSLLRVNSRDIDKLDFEVTEDDGSVHVESFYFDITAGFNAG